MHIRSIALVCLLTSSLFAAGPTSVLLMGDSPGSGATATRAIVGDMAVRAGAITYDSREQRLHCAGEVTIEQAGKTIRAENCTIAVGGGATVYILNRNGVTVRPARASVDAQGRAGWQSIPSPSANEHGWLKLVPGRGR